MLYFVRIKLFNFYFLSEANPAFHSKSLVVASIFSILKKELPLVVLFEQKKIVTTTQGFSFLSGLVGNIDKDENTFTDKFKKFIFLNFQYEKFPNF